MRMYETIFIVQPDLGEEEMKAISTKVQDVIANMKGDFKRLEDWGPRKLAYPIAKFHVVATIISVSTAMQHLSPSSSDV